MLWFTLTILIIGLVVWFIKKTGTPKTFVKSLILPLVVSYNLEKEKHPNASDEELAWVVFRARMKNPLGCRGLTEGEAKSYLEESNNIVDVFLSIAIRDLKDMGRNDSIHEAVLECVAYLSDIGLEEEIQKSNIYRGYFEKN